MMKKLVCILFLCLSTSAMGLTISRIHRPIKIDGNLDEGVWKTAERADLKEWKGGRVTNRTTVQMAYDDSFLYAAFTCYESRMDRLKTTWDHPEERDNALWNDDCVELYLDPFASGTHFYQIIINSACIVADAKDSDWTWNPKVVMGTVKGKDRWTMEVAIPFADLGYLPKGGEVWKGNLCREEKPAEELSSLYVTMGSFGTPSKFGPLEFQPVGGKPDFALTRLYGGKLTGEITNLGKSAEKYQIAVRTKDDLKTISEFSTVVGCAASQHVPVSLAYHLDAKASALEVDVSEAATSKTIYRNQFEIVSVAPKSQVRVWQIDQPLYKELLSDQPAGLVKEGAMFWAHGMDAQSMRPWACEYGERYVYDEYLPLLAKNKLWPILTNGMFINPFYKFTSFCDRCGIKGILEADPRGGNAPTLDGHPFLLDPEVIQYYEAKTLKEIKSGGDVFWAVSYGDEIQETNENLVVSMFATMKDKYPYIRQANEDVKKNFGGGKYGIPESKNDKNPYRWIALRRWQNARYNELFTRLYKEIKKVNPRIQVISPDPTAMHHPYDFSEWGKYSDILTHQLYPQCNANLATFGFHTKLIKDLSGVKEVWPCLHVENYAASFTPKEALELLSEAFRNGATGFHYYLCDTIGRYAKKGYMIMEYYGAPDRWQLEMAVMDEVRQMNQIRYPSKADCAIFYSCTSYAAQPTGVPTDEVEIAYTFLGPIAGSWFKFIDDYQIERGTVNLADYKVIYIPYAPYQQESVIAKFADYVKNGGVLVCGDPEVFSHNPLGGDVSSRRKEIFGVDRGGVINKAENMVWRDEKLRLASKAYEAHPFDGATVAARFADGSPAIIGHEYGKGKTLYFTANPFRLPAPGKTNWRLYFKTLQKTLGLAVDYDIWRFQFPESLIKPLAKPTGRCLTNNYLFWESGKPNRVADVDTHGTYCFSPAPDGIRDESHVSSAIPFTVGKLTNRVKAFTAGNVDLGTSRLDDWVVRYDNPEPFTLTFDFQQAYPGVEKVVLFYTGELPAVRVEVSSDGKIWRPFATHVAQPSTSDVYDLTLTGSPCSARYVRLSFGSRAEKKSFTLAEAEIWTR